MPALRETPRARFDALLRTAIETATLLKLTLGKSRAADPTLKNIFVRPVALHSGPHLAFVFRHATRDVTKNFPPPAALAELARLIGADFLDAHLFTTTHTVQLETQPDASARVKITPVSVPAQTAPAAPPPAHDRAKHHFIPADAPWLRALGVTNDHARPREGMADKFAQIQKFAELLTHLLAEAFPSAALTPRIIAAPGSTTPSASNSDSDSQLLAGTIQPRAQSQELRAEPNGELRQSLSEFDPTLRGTGSQLSTLSSQLHESGIALSSQPPNSAPQLPAPASQLRILDAGSGKGYLTFALAHLLGPRATITGIESRPELVALCNRLARENNFPNLTFTAARIADSATEYAAPASSAPLTAAAPTASTRLATAAQFAAATTPSSSIENRKSKIQNLDVLLALHACDTATDDALARGIAAGARLLVVAPCCQKELRAQLIAPPVLADALRHGIFQERQAEFVTDALRAQLLEWAGYRTKVFEFISTEHTAKNLMIAAIRTRPCGTPDDLLAQRLRAFATFYGLRTQALATQLGCALTR